MDITEEYYWLNKKSRTFLQRDYLKDGQEPEDRIKRIAEHAELLLGIGGFAEKFIHYMKKGYISLSSPVWANFAHERGLPCSCNGSYVPDNMYGILEKVAEVGAMTKNGAGTAAYFGDLRPRGAPISMGGASSGPVHFMQLFDKVASIVSQSSVRRGSFAAYLPVDHPDILEFLKIRSEGDPIQEMSIGVCISDNWIKAMKNGDKDKKEIWLKIIQKRFETGYPYLFFTDNVNNQAPDNYKQLNKKIKSSQLCSEVLLHTDENHSFVCNLSSINLLHWDEIKNTDLIETMIFFLDAVTSEYIYKTNNVPFMKSAQRFAIKERAVGLGVLGWHSLLQNKMIPFESMQAKYLNSEIFQFIKEKADKANKDLATIFGEPEDLKGTGLRMSHTLAIAPTTSSSFILGQISQGIEPLNSNYFVQDRAKGKFTFKNPCLKTLLKKYDKNTPEVWESILKKGGSVQHLEFLTQLEKEVFKTFAEISQKEIVIQAVTRQKFIDQGQSLNLMIHPKTPIKEVSQLLLFGWEQGIKTFYYQHGKNMSQELGRSLMECVSCQA
jgi:ribonucleoside-diphosphate reductase alpha chain